LLLAVAVALALSSPSTCDDAKDDAKKIQGTWVPMSGELAGKPFPDETLKTIKLVITEGKYKATVGTESDEGTFMLDPAAKPKAMDVTGNGGPNKGKTIPAVYELTDDTLTVCYNLGGKDRPTEFKTKEGTQLFLVTYKRE
jgi:uncharacterized protein (TIGR03067 family)